MGAPPTEPKGWRVEIKDPRHPRQTATEAFLKDMSMSTSGTYEKFFRAEGRHLRQYYGPAHGIPRRRELIGFSDRARTVDSEAWTKPYFVNGRQWTVKHKPEEFRVFFCEDRMEQPCAWLQ